MDFTFGIITEGNNDNFITKIVKSIKKQNIKNYEILIIGNTNIKEENVRCISFDENQKSKWITKKKNTITKEAKYENIVYLHDYITFNDNWYNSFLEFGNDWHLCMNVIKNNNGNRFRDWCLWYHDVINIEPKIKETRELLLPYNCLCFNNLMYFSGTYWLAKKYIMEEFPLDESLSWGEGEDVEWSKRVRNKYLFSMNENSTVSLLKEKNMDFNLCSNDTINNLILKNK